MVPKILERVLFPRSKTHIRDIFHFGETFFLFSTYYFSLFPQKLFFNFSSNLIRRKFVLNIMLFCVEKDEQNLS